MFNNVGRKIMMIADIYAALGIVACIMSGLYLIMQEEVFFGVLAIIAGPLSVYMTAILIFGFGKLIDNTERI